MFFWDDITKKQTFIFIGNIRCLFKQHANAFKYYRRNATSMLKYKKNFAEKLILRWMKQTQWKSITFKSLPTPMCIFQIVQFRFLDEQQHNYVIILLSLLFICPNLISLLNKRHILQHLWFEFISFLIFLSLQFVYSFSFDIVFKLAQKKISVFFFNFTIDLKSNDQCWFAINGLFIIRKDCSF